MTKTKIRSALEQVEFVKELPPKPPSRNLYSRQAEQLRENPGEWACLAKCPSRVAAYGAGSARKKKWGDEFEIDVRGQEVYARFTGEASKTPRTSKVKRKSVKSAGRKAGVKKKKAEAADTASES